MGLMMFTALDGDEELQVPVIEEHVGQQVYLFSLGKTGTAFPIHVTDQGFTILLTAKHVTESSMGWGTATVTVDGEPVPVTRVEQHLTEDVALIWIQRELPVLPLSDHEPRFGERAQVSGLAFGRFLLFSEGLISSPTEVSADIMPGCSGGPVFVDGRVVGVAVANLQFGGIPVGAMALFVKISTVRDWIDASL